jgi:integrase/recombinase XerD
MLTELFPRVHRRYSSLKILGRILGDYALWLLAEGYPRERVRQHLRTAVRLERVLAAQKQAARGGIGRERLRACAPPDTQADPDLAALVRSLERYLDVRRLLAPPPATRIERVVAVYGEFLSRARGFAPSTVVQHAATVSRLLEHVGYEHHPTRIAELAPADIEAFIQRTGRRISRAALQHVVAHVRGFLRYQATQNRVPRGLDGVIDTPRVYRGERLPRALPWTTVSALLRSIDRSTPIGRRDFAILLLIAAYGLRTSDVVALRLEDIEWRAQRIRISQRKTGVPLLLPLTDEVGAALVDYLRRGRPPLLVREVFLRARAPAGALKPTAVTEVFQAWSRRSGLSIGFQGPHCIRHSLAVHLLRQGTSLKTIGDLLGHRSAEATCMYLRLAVEDLRDVALPVPVEPSGSTPTEDRT